MEDPILIKNDKDKKIKNNNEPFTLDLVDKCLDNYIESTRFIDNINLKLNS